MQDLNGKLPNQTQTNPLKTVAFDKLVKVDAEKFERYDQMLSEVAMILDLDDVVLVMRVIFL